MAIRFTGARVPKEGMLMGVRWSLADPLRTRHVEALMAEREVHVDHATLNRWVITWSPLLDVMFHRRKRPVWVRWRLDATSVTVQGVWHYLSRAVDKYGAR